MTSPGRTFDATAFAARREGKALGSKLAYLDSCASTQAEALARAKDGAGHGDVVLARTQTAGKGRQGRGWVSVDEGLFFSIVLRPELAPEKMPRLTLLAGAGIVDALRKAGAGVVSKWPNDILAPWRGGGALGAWRKVGGCLVEGVTSGAGLEGAVLGVGLNLRAPTGGFSGEIADVAASLEDAGLEVELADALDLVLDGLERFLAEPGDDARFAAALELLSSHSATVGHSVRVDGGELSGHATGFDADGALLVKDGAGEEHRVVAGDVWPVS
jgi:BirA family biotin operon repressor/biotin-[acetyl-CoA-carboxylase] ligase